MVKEELSEITEKTEKTLHDLLLTTIEMLGCIMELIEDLKENKKVKF